MKKPMPILEKHRRKTFWSLEMGCGFYPPAEMHRSKEEEYEDPDDR